MKLFFINAIGKETLVADVPNQEAVIDELYEHCTSRGVRVPYLRCWVNKDKNRRIYDFGSYTEFYSSELE